MAEDQNKKHKNEIEQMNSIFEEFEKKRDDILNRIDNYDDIFSKKEMLVNFNRRVIECNK